MIRKILRVLSIAGPALALSACASGPGFDLSNFPGMEPSSPPSAFGAYLAGRQAQLDRDTEAAADYYRQALEYGSTNPEVLERAYVLEISNGNIREAARLAEVAYQLDPNNMFARLTLAVDDIERGNYARARNWLDGDDSSSLTALTVALLEAWTYVGTGSAEDGLAILTAADEIQGVELFKIYHGALLSDLAGENEAAELGYVTAIRASGGASARLVQAYGNFLERQGRREDAIQIYDAYLQLSPGNPLVLDLRDRAESGRRAQRLVRTGREGAAEALFSIASVIAGEGAYEVPSLYLRFALHLNPDLDGARILLAEIYDHLELDDQAVEVYASVPRNSPFRLNADIQRALMLGRLDREDEAVAILEELTEAEPRSMQAWLGLADALRESARYDEAVNAYAQAIGFLPEEDQNEPRYWALYYAYGICLERSDHWPEAEAAFLQALELNPDQPYVLNYLGYSWIEKGINLDEALAMIHRAVEQEPQAGFIVDSLGWGYYQLGRYEEAVRYLEDASQLQPGDATVNDHLGDAYWRVGMERQARYQWQHALDSDPDPEMVPILEDKLANGLGDQPQMADGQTGE